MIHHFLPEMKINESMNLDEAVACGAALQAAILECDQSDSLKNLAVFDVAPLSLGIDIRDGMMRTIVKRNTVIPVSKTAIFSTLEDSQQSLIFPIGEGECVKAHKNRLLGKISLHKIHPAPGADHQFDINFRIDANGCLNVFTYQGEVKIESKIIFRDDRLKKEQIDRLAEEATCYHRKVEQRSLIKARDALKSYSDAISSKFEKGNRKCQEISLFVKGQGNAMTNSKDDIERKKKELDQIVDEIRLIQESLNAGSNDGNSSKRQRIQ